LNVAVTPGGASDTPRLTAELKEPIEVTGTVAEPDPALSVIGEMGPRENPLDMAPGAAKNVCEHRLLVPPAPVQQSSGLVVMSVRVVLSGGVSKSIRNKASGGLGKLPLLYVDVSWIRSVLVKGSRTGQISKGL
jgi:hypothetical protein